MSVEQVVREWADDGSFDTRLEWDESIRLTYVTDAHGNETWHYYDILGYAYRIRHADGLSEWLFRDEAKNVVRHVHPDGTTDRYSYDERGNRLEHIRADNTVVHLAYDDQNQVIKVMDAEPGTFIPVAQALTHSSINLMGLPSYDEDYSLDEDPLWNHSPVSPPIDVLTWYQCDHLGTPQELTDQNGVVAWSAQYKAWGRCGSSVLNGRSSKTLLALRVG